MIADVVARTNDVVGESPRWDDRSGLLVWVDAARPVAHTFDPIAATVADHPLPRAMSSIALRARGGFLLTDADGVWAFAADFTPGPRLAAFPSLPAGYYANDSGVDAGGRLWVGVGSDDPDGREGRVDRVAADGRVETVLRGYALPNGIGWSPDGATLYVCDSGTSTLYAFAFDPATGVPGQRRILYRTPAGGGLVDGLTVAADGSLLIAFWGGRCVRHLDANGGVLAEIALPVVQPAAVCLGGEGLRDCFVTSANCGLDDHAADDGALWRFAAPSAGRPASRCAL